MAQIPTIILYFRFIRFKDILDYTILTALNVKAGHVSAMDQSNRLRYASLNPGVSGSYLPVLSYSLYSFPHLGLGGVGMRTQDIRQGTPCANPHKHTISSYTLHTS